MSYYRGLDISIGGNSLAHFKYIDRFKKNGEWRYIYPEDRQGRQSTSTNAINNYAQQQRGASARAAGEARRAIADRQNRIAVNNKVQASNARTDASSRSTKPKASPDFSATRESYAQQRRGESARAAGEARKATVERQNRIAVNNKVQASNARTDASSRPTMSKASPEYLAKQAAEKEKLHETPLTKATKQITSGLNWLKEMFKEKANVIKSGTKDFTSGVVSSARAVKEGVESAAAAKRNKDAYDRYQNGRNSDSNLSWDEYNRRQGMSARNSYAKEHSEYTKARSGLNDTTTGRAIGKALDKADSYINSKYSVPTDSYKNKAIEEERKRRARAAAGYKAR